MSDLSKNDQRVLDAVREACERPGWDGFIPHLSRDWTGIRRLENAGLVEFLDFGRCEFCSDHQDAPIYRLTALTKEQP